MSTPEPKLRWYQYRLRTLLILGLLASLGLSWYAVRRRAARNQKEAVARIRAVGGEVSYDQDRGGVDVTYVRFGPKSSVTDADLRHLQALRHLEQLHVFHDSITDAGLTHLEGLKSLKDLGLRGNRITDAGLQHLERLPIRRLFLVENPKVTGAGLDRFTQLESLKVWLSPLTDTALRRLEVLAHLRRLDLLRTSVTDAGLKDMKLPSLEQLELDAHLFGTEGVQAFQNAHPKCRVASREAELELERRAKSPDGGL